MRFVLDEMVVTGYEPGEASVEKFVEDLCKDDEWSAVVEVLCRLAKVSEQVFDAWEMAISCILKETKVKKAAELVHCLLLG